MSSTSERLAREQLEEAWHLRCDQALHRYKKASAEYRSLLKEEPSNQTLAAEHPLMLARAAESEALAEYSRILKLFTELTIHGRIPEEGEDTGVDGKRIMTRPTLVSVVDDDESIRDSTGLLLKSAGYSVATFESAELFLESRSLSETACLILDIRMPGMDGLELQQRLHLSDSDVPVIFISAHYDARNCGRATDAGAAAFFQKPFRASDLLTAVETAVKNRPGEPGDRGRSR